ncbi:MAG: GNAT family N-acetyltransferase [Candidatus Sumerlaeaceae bacterium]|nr:GNAT family N-acetyltransferase [Candidatus Sumerlaeaceae bacterium]
MTQPGLILRELNAGDEAAFLEGWREWEGEDLTWYAFDWKPGMPFAEYLERLRKNSLGIDLPEDHVASTMLYGFVDGAIVGRVSIRHRLTETLLQRGGHMGYAVAPRFRRQGYAFEMARLAIPICRNLGLERILVTCTDANEPSWRIIERLGGTLENKAWCELHNEVIRRYWIDLG